MHIDYQNLTVKQLLKKLKQGKGMPGSGCAATLSALMGIAILQSVCKISLTKKENGNKEALQNALTFLEEQSIPELTVLMQQDADAVETMLQDKNITPELTTTPIDICKECLDALEIGLEIFDSSFTPMLADSATALTLIDSTIRATLFISQENLKGKEQPTLSKRVTMLEKKYIAVKEMVNKRLYKSSNI